MEKKKKIDANKGGKMRKKAGRAKLGKKKKKLRKKAGHLPMHRRPGAKGEKVTRRGQKVARRGVRRGGRLKKEGKPAR